MRDTDLIPCGHCGNTEPVLVPLARASFGPLPPLSRCVAPNPALRTCDCTADCLDDPGIRAGKANPCARGAQLLEEARRAPVLLAKCWSCGVSMPGLSRDDVVAKWNQRSHVSCDRATAKG